MKILDQYAVIKGKKIRYLSAGSGPPLLLLHASPMMADVMRSLMQALSPHYTLIAADTPGYGFSDPPNEFPESINFYAETLHEFMRHLGIEKYAVYGTATGAQIAIRMGLLYPQHIEQLFLDNCAHFSEEEVRAIAKDYFPTISPQKDGSHLRQVWDIVLHLFQYFPWCFKTEAYRLPGAIPPPAVLHAIAGYYLICADKYDWAYRVAFEHEKVENIQQLKIPAHIFRWESSILKSYTDRLFDYELPASTTQGFVAADADRNEQMATQIIKYYKGKIQSIKPGTSIRTENVPAFDFTQLPDFPTPESSGNYLMEAWNALDDFLSAEQQTIENFKHRVFIHWSKQINSRGK